MQKTHCRLCGADDAEFLRLTHDLALEDDETFPLVRCRHCGLMYLQIRPSPAEMGRYYPPEYHRRYRPAVKDEPFFLMRWIRQLKFRRRKQTLEEVSTQVPGRILDVGCSTGAFLDSMRECGWETYGVETSSYAVNYARKQLGLEVFEGRLTDAQLPTGHFDVVTLWDVLEHTFDPLAVLYEVNRLLVDDGIVALTVPNWKSWDRRLFGHAWIGYDPPRHLYVFTQPVLQSLFEKAGFRILRTWCGFGGYFTFTASVRLWLKSHLELPWLRRMITKVLDFPGMRFPFEPFFFLSDRAGRGGTLVILARKFRGVYEEYGGKA